MTLSLELDKNSSATISCYAPTLNSPEMEIDEFYDQLRSVILKVSHSDKLVLMGDFNARVGTDNETLSGVLGSQGLGKMNANGLRLLSLCKEFDLSITNTYFQQHNNHKTSWMHPRSKDWHLIDYVITKKRHFIAPATCLTMYVSPIFFVSPFFLYVSPVCFVCITGFLYVSPVFLYVSPVSLYVVRYPFSSLVGNAFNHQQPTSVLISCLKNI